MMATVKDLISSIDLAKRLDLARNVGNSAAKLAKRGGSSAAVLARRGSDSAVVLAKKVGPRRALIGLAVVGGVIGGIVLIRYLRAHREEGEEDLDASEEPQTAAGRRARKEARAKRRAHEAITH